ncbi:lysophospholipase L1-like esterase [Nocardioides thalensis]|uniref:Lysophospholipase L1-like esterase n=1 Tax=Nocardioides thalensis TaxID=1914755 RepID=A0A853C9F7_9ACTN|nr:SGNH/GDSL hydrolase family protein [Nocardioides thalensis]NYJ03078.1 lysophospholipase L1-like esterase [Nocardioides thalensis]
MRSSVLPGLLAAVALLAACEDAPDPEPLPDHLPVSPGDRYVAMGDSYTAAAFAPYESETNGCLQSIGNYPHLLEKELGLELTDVSCGGAKTESIHLKQQTTTLRERMDPQIDALTEHTALVTISIGANDEEIFPSLVVSCAQELTPKERDGAPCTDRDAGDGDDSFAARIDRMEERIIDVLAAITEEAPQARVVFVGYPQFASDESCRQFPIAEGDTELAERVNILLVEAQERAAAEAGVEFLDLYELTEGHHFCADDPWVAGMHPAGDAAQWHPYPKEQQVAAEALAELVA